MTLSEVFPLLWSKDVARVGDWAVSTLGLKESWRASGESGDVEHLELHWLNGKISINIDRGDDTGPSGIALRVDDKAVVNEIHDRAVQSGAEIIQGPEDSRIAYSFTARDPDGNQWWVNAENGFLDELRS